MAEFNPNSSDSTLRQRARTMFFTLLDRSPIGYALLDEQGVIQDVNHTFCDWVACELTQLVGKPIQNPIDDDDRPAFMDCYYALFRYPRDNVLELRLKRDGKPMLWVRVQGERFLLPNDQAGAKNIERLLLAFSDITAQKKSEEDRRLGKRRLQSLMEIAEYPYTSVEELLRFTLEKAVAVTGSEFGYLLDYDEATQQLRIRLVSERAQQESKLDPTSYPQAYPLSESDLRAEAVRQRKPVIINDYSQPHPQKRGYPEGHVEIRRFLSVPIFKEGWIVAVISVANKAELYTENDARQLSLMMDVAWKMVVHQRLNEALQESEERYRKLVENAPDLVYCISFVPEQHFEYVSPSATTITGYTPEEHYADPIWVFKIVHPDDHPVLQKIAAEGVKTGEKIVLRWIRKDGRVIWTEQQGTPIFDSTGNLIALEGAARDITERKEAELALQNLLQEFEILFIGVQDAVFLIKVEEDGEFRYLRTNKTHQQKTGTPLGMIQGKTPQELVGEKLGSILRSNYQRCVDIGHPITYEETLDLPGGRRTWLTALAPVYRGGRVKYIVGASMDITEQKAAQEAIRRSEERYRTLFENMTEGFALHEIILNEDGRPLNYRFLEVNPAFESLTGLKAEQVVGETVRQLLPNLEQSWIERYGEVAEISPLPYIAILWSSSSPLAEMSRTLNAPINIMPTVIWSNPFTRMR